MADKAGAAGGIIGLVFLALAAAKLVQGENWVVWAILGFLFGGFGTAAKLFGGNKG